MVVSKKLVEYKPKWYWTTTRPPRGAKQRLSVRRSHGLNRPARRGGCK